MDKSSSQNGQQTKIPNSKHQYSSTSTKDERVSVQNQRQEPPSSHTTENNSPLTSEPPLNTKPSTSMPFWDQSLTIHPQKSQQSVEDTSTQIHSIHGRYIAKSRIRKHEIRTRSVLRPPVNSIRPTSIFAAQPIALQGINFNSNSNPIIMGNLVPISQTRSINFTSERTLNDVKQAEKSTLLLNKGSEYSTETKQMNANNSNSDPKLNMKGYETKSQGMSEDEYDSFLVKRYFTVRLAEALSTYGAPSYRLEHILSSTANNLQLLANFATLPNVMIISLEVPSRSMICNACSETTASTSVATETLSLALQPGYDMGRLYATSRLTQLLADGKVTIDEAIDHLDYLILEPCPTTVDPDFGRHTWWWCRDWPQVFSSILASCSAALLLFNGNWADVWASGMISFLVHLVSLMSIRFKPMRLICQPIAAFLGGLFGLFCVVWIPRLGEALRVSGGLPVCYRTITIAGLMSQLPGLTLCTAMIDMTSGHMISGTSRLISGMVKALVLALGLITGTNAYMTIAKLQAHDFSSICATVHPVSSRSYWQNIRVFLLLALVTANAMGMKSAPRQFPIMMTTGFISYWLIMAFDFVKIGPDAASVASAFIIGIVSNIYSRCSGNPAIAPLLGGVSLLVPGGMGVRSTMGLLDPQQFGAGSGFALDVIVIAAWMSIGILGSHIIPPIEIHIKPNLWKTTSRHLSQSSRFPTSQSDPSKPSSKLDKGTFDLKNAVLPFTESENIFSSGEVIISESLIPNQKTVGQLRSISSIQGNTKLSVGTLNHAATSDSFVGQSQQNDAFIRNDARL